MQDGSGRISVLQQCVLMPLETTHHVSADAWNRSLKQLGDGPEFSELEDQLRRATLERRKRWVGKDTWTDDIWDGKWNWVDKDKYPAHPGERWKPGDYMYLDVQPACTLTDVLQLAMHVTEVALVRWNGTIHRDSLYDIVEQAGIPGVKDIACYSGMGDFW